MRYYEGHNVIVPMVETIGRSEGVNFSARKRSVGRNVRSPTRSQRIRSFLRSLLCLD